MLVAVVDDARLAAADGMTRGARVLAAEVYLLRRGLVEPTELFPIVEGEILSRSEYSSDHSRG